MPSAGRRLRIRRRRRWRRLLRGCRLRLNHRSRGLMLEVTGITSGEVYSTLKPQTLTYLNKLPPIRMAVLNLPIPPPKLQGYTLPWHNINRVTFHLRRLGKMLRMLCPTYTLSKLDHLLLRGTACVLNYGI